MIRETDGLTALPEGTRHVAAVSREATVNTKIDARRSRSVYTCFVERSSDGPLIERSNDESHGVFG